MNSLLVLKYGGAAMDSGSGAEQFVRELVARHKKGARIVLVHGGGPEIDRALARQGIEPKRVNGLRVTDEATMEVVQMVLAGKVNKRLAALVQKCGGKAIGLCGADGGLLQCRKKSPCGEDLGLVGEIIDVNTQLIYSLLGSGYIPIIASTGMGRDGEIYNINADEAAAALTVALHAESLILLTDVAGILRRYPEPSSLIPSLTSREAYHLIEKGVLDKGMVPKLQACIRAVEGGATFARIMDGRSPELVGEALHGQSEMGTRITAY